MRHASLVSAQSLGRRGYNFRNRLSLSTVQETEFDARADRIMNPSMAKYDCSRDTSP